MSNKFTLRYNNKEKFVSEFDYYDYPLTNEEVLSLLNKLTKEQIEKK